MTDSSSFSFPVLAYWQRDLWQSIFNTPIINLDKICAYTQIAAPALAQGNIPPKVATVNKVWVAPFVFLKPTTKQPTLIPIWLPAQIQADQLVLRENRILPWMPPVLLDTLNSESVFAGQMNAFDDWLRHDIWLEEQLIWQNWAELYQNARLLLDKLCGGNLVEILTAQGWVLDEKVCLIDETVLHQLADWPTAGTLLNQFTVLEETPPKISLGKEQLLERAHLLNGVCSALPFTPQESTALLQTLLLEEGELLAIKAPVSCRKQNFIASLAATKLVTAALANNPLAELVLLSPSGIEPLALDLAQSLDTQLNLAQCYANFKEGIHLAKQFWQETAALYDEEPTDFVAYIESLKQQDEEYEKQLTLFQQVQQKFRHKFMPQSVWSKFQRLLTTKGTQTQEMKELLTPLGEQFMTLSENVDEKISDNIRQLKVLRTKIHQELVERIEKNNHRVGDERRWLSWLTEHLNVREPLLHLEQAIALIQIHFGPLLVQLSQSFAQPQNGLLAGDVEVFPGWSLYQFDYQALRWQGIAAMPLAQLLIVDQANRLLGQQVAPLLNKAQQAVFLGDSDDLTAFPSITPAQEAYDFAQQAIDDEDLLDQLQYKGMLKSAGNAFEIAKANSSYQSYDQHTALYRSQCTLQDLTDSLLKTYQKGEYEVPSLKEERADFAGFHFIPATGKSKKVGNTLINPAEAKKIATWLKTQAPPDIPTDWVIVTPFLSQKALLLAALEAEHLTCRVFTCLELPERQWNFVIFSPVYSMGDARPFIFDQGENLLASVISRARLGVWIIGDKAIFDLKMHSPSGKLAKLFLPPKRKTKQAKQSASVVAVVPIADGV